MALPLPITRPVWLTMAKAGIFAASPTQLSPSEATPQNCWSGRWKVSCASIVAGRSEVGVVAVIVATGVDLADVLLLVEDARVVATGFITGNCTAPVLNTARGRVNDDCTCAEKRKVIRS